VEDRRKATDITDIRDSRPNEIIPSREHPGQRSHSRYPTTRECGDIALTTICNEPHYKSQALVSDLLTLCAAPDPCGCVIARPGCE
jgi:hypothetical protein